MGSTPLSVGGYPCQNAEDEIWAKYEECGKEIPPDSGIDRDGDGICDEAEGKKAPCVAACLEATSCDCAGRGDTTACGAAGEKSYSDCLDQC